MDQVYAVSRRNASTKVDLLRPDAEHMVSVAVHRLVLTLAQEVLDNVGLTLHTPDIMSYTTKDEFHPWMTKILLRWEPQVQTAELIGGHPLDGTVLTSPLVPRQHIRTPASTKDQSGAGTTWECSGWSPERRVWLYSPTGA